MRSKLLTMTRSGMSLVMLIALIGLSLPAPQAAARAYQGANLLQNPGFEPPYTAIGQDDSLRVASGWLPWNVTGTGPTSINRRPEYKQAPSNRVRSGTAAQEYNTFFATHMAGVYQRVPVAAGSEVRFSIFVYVWSSATFANPDLSEEPNQVIVNVGIDPKGGTNGESDDIIWSADAEFYDQYRELSIMARSEANAVTVFVRSAPQGFVGTNNIYLDDAALVVLSTAAPTLTPVPTNTPDTSLPVPTQEGTITPVPATRTPLPTFTPNVPVPTATPSLPTGFNSTVLHTVVAGDTVWGIAQRYNSATNAIIQMNGLNANGFLRIGQVLIVPVRDQFQQPPTFTPVPIQPGISTPTPVPVTPGVQTYTVRSGDTLSVIAARFNTTVATLAQLNNITNPNLIFAGQVLRVPGTAPAPQPTPAPAPTAVPPAGPRTHTVRPGENLFRISLIYGVTADALARANNIWNPNLIFAGQVLVIP